MPDQDRASPSAGGPVSPRGGSPPPAGIAVRAGASRVCCGEGGVERSDRSSVPESSPSRGHSALRGVAVAGSVSWMKLFGDGGRRAVWSVSCVGRVSRGTSRYDRGVWRDGSRDEVPVRIRSTCVPSGRAGSTPRSVWRLSAAAPWVMSSRRTGARSAAS